ncbi:YbhN family protein [Halobacteriaceae archaeon GCM10025711]
MDSTRVAAGRRRHPGARPGFVTDIERVSADRRGLATALGYSALGWFLQAVALWLAFSALGVHVSLAATLFVVPVGTVAGVAPLPGGLGGIEAVLVALLVPVTGVSVGLVTAAVIIYRGTIFWLPVVVGGGALAAFAHRENLPAT